MGFIATRVDETGIFVTMEGGQVLSWTPASIAAWKAAHPGATPKLPEQATERETAAWGVMRFDNLFGVEFPTDLIHFKLTPGGDIEKVRFGFSDVDFDP